MPNNTTDDQDIILEQSVKTVNTSLNGILYVLNALDLEITEWKIASGCETPKELARKLQKTEGK